MSGFRSVGNVDLTWGLVTSPVKMTAVSSSHDRKGSMYHAHDDGTYGKVKMPKSCEDCGAVLQQGEISKGFEENGDIVILSADDLETVEGNSGGSAMEIEKFVPVDQVDPLLFAGENAYRLVPDPKRGKQALATYVLIREKLIEKGLAGVVQYTRWGRNRTGLLIVEPTADGGVLVVRNMMWHDELRPAEFDILSGVDASVIDPRLLPVADQLVESMTGDWDPTEFTDSYMERLTEAIAAKAAGGEVVASESRDGGGIDDVSELLARLEQSNAAKAAAAKPARKPRAKKTDAA